MLIDKWIIINSKNTCFLSRVKKNSKKNKIKNKMEHGTEVVGNTIVHHF